MGTLVGVGGDFADASVVDRYINHLSSARGIVRTEITQRHLADVCLVNSGEPRVVLDVGCGDGRDSIWLASLGHSVVGVDPSEEMIDRANLRLKEFEKSNGKLAGDIELRTSGVTETAEKYSDEFDLILSHGVIMYADDPKEFIAQHVSMLRDGGSLSLLTKNAYALAYRAAGEGHYADARRLLVDPYSIGHLGIKVEAHTVQQLADIAATLGCLVSSWAGVRIFSDLDFDTVDAAELLSLEWESARAEPYRQTASLVHLIIHKGLSLDDL
jgi:S-adenosylmethionine-dependent methyltransferase